MREKKEEREKTTRECYFFMIFISCKY